MRRTADQGAAAAELIILAPLIMMAMLLVVLASRQVSGQLAAQAVAHAAAREASLHQDETAARAAATTIAQEAVATHDLTCTDHDLTLDLDGLVPGGTVTATLTCHVDQSDMAMLAVAPSRELTAQATVVIDTYRGITP